MYWHRGGEWNVYSKTMFYFPTPSQFFQMLKCHHSHSCGFKLNRDFLTSVLCLNVPSANRPAFSSWYILCPYSHHRTASCHHHLSGVGNASYGQEERHRQKPSLCGDPGLHLGYLLRQDRHAHNQPDVCHQGRFVSTNMEFYFRNF